MPWGEQLCIGFLHHFVGGILKKPDLKTDDAGIERLSINVCNYCSHLVKLKSIESINDERSYSSKWLSATSTNICWHAPTTDLSYNIKSHCKISSNDTNLRIKQRDEDDLVLKETDVTKTSNERCFARRKTRLTQKQMEG